MTSAIRLALRKKVGTYHAIIEATDFTDILICHYYYSLPLALYIPILRLPQPLRSSASILEKASLRVLSLLVQSIFGVDRTIVQRNMLYSVAFLALAAAVCANPFALPQAVTAAISPTAASPPGCTPSASGSFGIAVQNVSTSASVAKRRATQLSE